MVNGTVWSCLLGEVPVPYVISWLYYLSQTHTQQTQPHCHEVVEAREKQDPNEAGSKCSTFI